MKDLFVHLDQDEDNYLNYNEFAALAKRDKVKSPRLKEDVHSVTSSRISSNLGALSNDFQSHLDANKLDQLSVSSFYYKGYKYGGSRLGHQESRLSKYSWISEKPYGIPSPETQKIDGLINHSYLNERTDLPK
jgi:hypothetical protein